MAGKITIGEFASNMNSGGPTFPNFNPPNPGPVIVEHARGLVNKVKGFFNMSNESYISFDEAVLILRQELNYPEERALHFVKRFDKNQDGRLSMAEFSAFKKKIEETKHSLVPKFKEYDRDNNGYITLAEASDILQNPPFNFPSEKVLVLLNKFDLDGNGKLDIEEFADFYAEAKATHEELARKFDELDKDRNGVLTPDEVLGVIRDLMGCDDKMARNMLQMFDQNQDGNLNKAEFMALWTSMFG